MQCQWLVSDHRLDIVCFTTYIIYGFTSGFTKYLVGDNSQNVMKCHRLVGVNTHSVYLDKSLV